MISLVVVSNIRVYREGLQQILGARERIRVDGTASRGELAISLARRVQPDVVLLDTSLDQSLWVSRQLTEASPGTRVVALGVCPEEDEVIAWAEAGVAGYVMRDDSLDDLMATIERAVRGEVRCSPSTAATLVRRIQQLSRERPRSIAHSLTVRELEIVELLDQGLSNKEIAIGLSIEVATVKNHVHHVLEKLQVSRRGQVAARVRSFAPLERGLGR